MFKKFLLLLVVALGAFAAFVSGQPNDFRITRTATIAASPEKIFGYLNNPKKMAEWSPWNKIDPNAKFSFEGPTAGVGAVSKWEGNMELGVGSATIIESKANELVKTRLDFVKPMKATNTGEFNLKRNGDTTEITWSMYGTSDFIGKAMGIIFNCDKMVGTQFEAGFANLKAIVEAKK